MNLTSITDASVEIYTENNNSEYQLLETLSAAGANHSFNVVDEGSSAGTSYLIVIPTSDSASVSVNVQRRTTIYEPTPEPVDCNATGT